MYECRDDDGQPINLAFNRQRRVDAGIDELLGFIRGILADEQVVTAEIDALTTWITKHRDIANDWPANVIIRKLCRIYDDEIVDEAERDDIKCLLEEVIGPNETLDAHSATTLPLCRPAPDVIFDSNVFVFTGKFLYGPRRVCEAEVIDRGGSCVSTVSGRVGYLVIGSLGSRDWIHSPWGRKIEAALTYRNACGLHIISEQHWSRFLLSGMQGLGASV